MATTSPAGYTCCSTSPISVVGGNIPVFSVKPATKVRDFKEFMVFLTSSESRLDWNTHSVILALQSKQ